MQGFAGEQGSSITLSYLRHRAIRIARKEEKLMATATLSATLNNPISGLRLAPMGRILIIEDDSALRKVLRRLFSSEGYEVDVASDAVCGLERLR